MKMIPSTIAFPSTLHEADGDSVSSISMDDSWSSCRCKIRPGHSESALQQRRCGDFRDLSDRTVLPQISDRPNETSHSGLPVIPQRRESMGGDCSADDSRPTRMEDSKFEAHSCSHGSCPDCSLRPPKFPRRRASLAFVSEEDEPEKPHDQAACGCSRRVFEEAHGSSSPPTRVQRRASLLASQAA